MRIRCYIYYPIYYPVAGDYFLQANFVAPPRRVVR